MGLKNAITGNFQRKIFSVLAAIIIWAVVNKSITSSRVFTRVPIRIVNLPADKTIRGLMPNNILERKLTLTLTGTKDVVDHLEPQDFEIVIDASDKGDEWIVQVGKKNLVSLNPDIDLMRNISQLSHSEFVIQLSTLITEKIPILVLPPRGEPPEGYQFLDIWPQKLTHIISGPEEDVRYLQEQGLELTLDLSDITKNELDALRSAEGSGADEVSYYVPDSSKKISIPFLNNLKQEINGPEARYLRVDFLRNEMLPLDRRIPVRVFYPLPTIEKINPKTLPLGKSDFLSFDDNIPVCSGPFFATDVSRLFLDVVRDRLEIVIIPPENIGEGLPRWEVQFIDPHQLEETYVQQLLKALRDHEFGANNSQLFKQHQDQREKYFRSRFREYMQRFSLHLSKGHPFVIYPVILDGKIVIQQEG